MRDQGAAEVRRRLAEYFIALAEEARPELRGAGQAVWLDRLEEEHANLIAVLEWCRLAGESTLELRLVTALWRFWVVRGYLSEGRTRLEAAIDHAGNAPPALQFEALNGAATLAFMQGDANQAATMASTVLAAARAGADAHGIGSALNTLGNIAQHEGDLERAVPLYTEAIETFRAASEWRSLAIATNGLGYVALRRGEFDRAAGLCEESFALQSELAHPEGMVIPLLNLGLAALGRRRIGDAHGAFTKSLELAWELRSPEFVMYAQEGLAAVAAATRDFERAARLVASAQAIRERVGIELAPVERDLHDRTVREIELHVPPHRVTEVLADARLIDLERSVTDALENLRLLESSGGISAADKRV